VTGQRSCESTLGKPDCAERVEETSDPGTVRERIRAALREKALTVREISQALSVTERVVVDALPHVVRSVEASGGTFITSPAECAACGFVFGERTRPGKPSRCPRCRATRVRPPRFRVEESVP
jgi:predicted Zn-ribbon and HTH transcriptional regulator